MLPVLSVVCANAADETSANMAISASRLIRAPRRGELMFDIIHHPFNCSHSGSETLCLRSGTRNTGNVMNRHSPTRLNSQCPCQAVKRFEVLSRGFQQFVSQGYDTAIEGRYAT